VSSNPAPTPQEDGPQTVRRQGPDRRKRPTPLLSRYTFLGGRRKYFRREEEGRDQFVDLYSPRLVALLITFFVLTLIDSIATIIYLGKGGHELNPIAQAMLNTGNIGFVLIKGSLTGICVLFVMMHKNFRYARVAIVAGFSFYFALAIYHLVLQVQSWHVPMQLAAK
jgi:hypothetical protein